MSIGLAEVGVGIGVGFGVGNGNGVGIGEGAIMGVGSGADAETDAALSIDSFLCEYRELVRGTNSSSFKNSRLFRFGVWVVFGRDMQFSSVGTLKSMLVGLTVRVVPLFTEVDFPFFTDVDLLPEVALRSPMT